MLSPADHSAFPEYYNPDIKRPPLTRPAPISRKNISYSEKILVPVEPDLGDPRKSIEKALPSRPTTPGTIMKRFRVTAVLPFAFAVISFALTLVFVLAGSKPGELEEQFMVSVSSPH
jgi:hypothetical protein